MFLIAKKVIFEVVCLNNSEKSMKQQKTLFNSQSLEGDIGGIQNQRNQIPHPVSGLK